MKVGQRLFLTVLPALLGLVLVAALAYWGRYASTAPELVVVLAAIAAMVSLIVSWRNTRYVVHCVERLAGHSSSMRGANVSPNARRDALRDLGLADGRIADSDELDYIEATVAGLSDELTRTREEALRREHEAQARAQELESLTDALIERFAARAQEAQLPLHILLSSPFGALNENQEEMLGAAMSAVDAIDGEVRELRKLVQLHRGELSIIPQPTNLAELLRPALAIAAARAETAQVQLRSSISDTAPRVIVDAVLAQEALTSILADAIAHTNSGGDVDVSAAEGERGRVRISIVRTPAADDRSAPAPLELRLARRLLEAQRCSIATDGASTTIDLPSETTSHVEP